MRQQKKNLLSWLNQFLTRPKKITPGLAWIIAAFLSMPATLSAEALFLHNGQVIYGSIEKVSDKQVIFRNEAGLRKTYPRKAVLRLNYGQQKLTRKYIYLVDGRQKHAFIVEEDADQIIIRTDLQKRKELVIGRSSIEVILVQPKQKKFYYTFTYPRQASTVIIEGDFTAWQPVNMEFAGKHFEKKIPIDILKKSEYQYRIVADDNPAKKQFIKFKLENGQLLEDIDRYRWTLGLRIGGGVFLAGPESNRLTVQQPVTGLMAQSSLPFILPELVAQVRFDYFNSRPRDEENPKIADYSIDASNLSFSGGLGYEYSFYPNFLLLPKLGFGRHFINWEISGDQSQSTSTAFFLLTPGLEVHYILNRSMNLVVDFQNSIQLEDGARQLFTVGFGVNFRL